jgi:hypothetical protein
MVRDAAHEGTGNPVPGRADSSSSLPYARAFVVQFASETDVRAGNVRGRIEHLKTGRRSRFASADELLSRIMAMLAGADASHDEG